MTEQQADHPRFVTIDYFIKDMLGYSNRTSYYNHMDDPGWPQRVYPAGKPMLVYDECVAYQRQIMANRTPPAEAYVKPSKKLGEKRHVGRPAKAVSGTTRSDAPAS